MGNGARRYGGNGLAHCELDVESADSGRGASEDDPNHVSVGPMMHFYPTFHLPHSTLHLNGVNIQPELRLMGNVDKSLFDLHASEAASMSSGNFAPTVVAAPAAEAIVDSTPSVSGQHTVNEDWNSGERHRLKC